MENFYITFGPDHLKNFDLPSDIRRNAFAVKVEATDMYVARAQVIQTSINTNFCTSYDQNDWDERLSGMGFKTLTLEELLKLEK